MKNFFEKIISQFNNRNPHERLIITITLLFIIFLVWIFCFYTPLYRIIHDTSQKLSVAKSNVGTLSGIYKNYQSLAYHKINYKI